ERPHTSARRYDLPARQTTRLGASPTKVMRDRHVHRGTLLFVAGILMLFMIFGFMALSWLANWWTTQTNDWTYGRPRTFQTDHVVGHSDGPRAPTHFLAMNLSRT